MNTKYSVYNPSTGENTIVDTKEEALSLFWTTMINFAKPYFHNTSYSTIQYNDDGTETWYNDSGNIINNQLIPTEIEQLLNNASSN